MTKVKFYGYGLPDMRKKELRGRFIVLEGTDGVGRSTQVALLREWLESRGYAVAVSGLKRSRLTRKGLRLAQEGNMLVARTSTLFYATDLADRLEREIIPALRAGFVVLTDRYIYSILCRALVRGLDRKWGHNVFGFALVPDRTFYLRIDLDHLIPRMLNARGFSYWESGRDLLGNQGYYENYVEYQSRVIAQFDSMAKEFDFQIVDATRNVHDVFVDLRKDITKLIKGMKPRSSKTHEQ
jgi:dTMP kinase